MKEAYVTFGQAKRLKELGFPQSWKDGIFVWYDIDGNRGISPGVKLAECAAPSLGQAQQWLFEKYNLLPWVEPEFWYSQKDNKHHILFYSWVNKICEDETDNITFKTYQDALRNAIDNAIDLINNGYTYEVE